MPELTPPVREVPFLRRRSIGLIDVVPVAAIILTLTAYWVYSNVITSGYPYQAQDPEYAYFMTSLAPFKGGGYLYADHPGTPLEVIGTLILAATYPFVARSPGGFVEYHLTHPQLFLSLAHALLLIASIACALLFYRTAVSGRRPSTVLAGVVLALLFYVLHPASFTTLSYWSHNSVAYPFGTLFLIVLYRALRGTGEIPLRTVVWVGLGVGVLTATMIYFLVWVVSACFAIALFYRLQHLAWRRTLVAAATFLAASAVGFGVAVLPALPRLRAFLSLVKTILFHQGLYGTGSSGFTSLNSLAFNFVYLWAQHSVVFISVGLALILLVLAFWNLRRRTFEDPGLPALAAGLTVQVLAFLLLVLKHPEPYHLLPIAATLPVMLLMVLRSMESRPTWAALLEKTLAIGGPIALAIALLFSAAALRQRIAYLSAANRELSQIVEQRAIDEGQSPSDVAVVWTNGIYSRCGALMLYPPVTQQFGNELGQLCPNQYNMYVIFFPRPLVTSSQGDQVQINSIKWDLIVAPKIAVGFATEFLRSGFTPAQLENVRMGLPGYETNAVIVMSRSPTK